MSTGEARELTPDEQEARGKLAHGIEQRIKTAIGKGREALWELAEAAYEFNEERGWSALSYDSVGEWLADPEISMKSSTFFRYTQVWRETVVKRGLDSERLRQLDMSKVAIVLPSINSGKMLVDEALNDVEALGANDLRDKYVRSGDPSSYDPNDPPVIEGKAKDKKSEPKAESAPPTFDEMVPEPNEPPSVEQWDEMADRAKRRKRGLAKYVGEMSDWILVKGDGSDPSDWEIPAFNPQTAWDALIAELASAAASGQANPRIALETIKDGLRALDMLEKAR